MESGASLNITAIILEDLAARLRAEELGIYPISSASARIFDAVFSDTFPFWPFITRETVIMLTPARSAISFNVTINVLLFFIG